ncbi:Vgb family protein [Paraliomyxa miuraensis]|uniref:Vgb family protein n=1 Tax=Paraliomyxa miuraensis TaxID=376150 RepID=UPI00224D5953|nr:hypothetical protein [Paraliomyxa miuraensis]MCX4246388.1 hypothetical protein [Paraliomyxa miuraensis]
MTTSPVDDTTTPDTTSSVDDGPKFDVGVDDVPACVGGGGGLDFSYIWIANSPQGTVSKIDTQTLTELGRYIVRPDSAGSPSRTSVNLVGDVAVGNRLGGMAKIYAQEDRCVEGNGIPGIQTSTGATDILPWGEDECLAWYTAAPGGRNQQRPVAWTSGVFDEEECAYVEQKIWSTASMQSSAGTVVALRYDGDSGVIEVELPVPEISTGSFGPYGGAVDANDDFWFHSRDAGSPHPLVHVYGDGSGYEIIPVPNPVVPYGITIDSQSRVWLAGYQGGIGRYDPVAGTWQTVAGVTGLGIQEDAQGRMWMAIYPWGTTGVVAFDINTMATVATYDMTGVAPQSRGISIDFDGYVWMVDQTDSAWKIDPDTGTWERYQGLTGPYTYSDMTGWGLSLVNTG